MAVAKRSTSSTRGKKKTTKAKKETAKKAVLDKREEASVEPASNPSADEVVLAESERTEERVESNEHFEAEEKKVEPLKTRLSDEYLIQCYFDKTENQFVASVLEMAHIKATGVSKADVIRDCENRLESHLNLLKRQGEALPETFQSRHYPETLKIAISQGLYRRLDLLSRQEKTSLDELVVELISGMVERRLHNQPKHSNQNHGHRSHSHQNGGHRDQHRNEHRREGHKNDGPREPRREHSHRDGQQPREGQRENPRDFASDHDNIGNLKREPQQLQQNRHQRGRGGRHFHKTMESRENFLEYVRNLEKGNWKKR